jgi:hypothetical protein
VCLKCLLNKGSRLISKKEKPLKISEFYTSWPIFVEKEVNGGVFEGYRSCWGRTDASPIDSRRDG